MLRDDPQRARPALMVAALLREPDSAMWVIERLGEPELAAPASAAFVRLTGVDPEREDLVIDDDDAGALLDADRCRQWLQAHGPPIPPNDPVATLRTGHQAFRSLAAVTLALRHPGVPLFPIAAPATAQIAALARLASS